MSHRIGKAFPVNRGIRFFFYFLLRFRLPGNPLARKVFLNCLQSAPVKPVFQFLRHQFPIRIDDHGSNGIPILVVLHQVENLVPDLHLVNRMP